MMIETASLLLVRRPDDPEVFWVRRAPRDRFLSGFHAFPGGRVDPGDVVEGDVLQTARRAALRETAEETGWLPGLGRLEPERRRRLRAGELGFDALAAGAALPLDAMIEAGLWVAPPYLVASFSTRFYALWVDDKASPRVDPGDPELSDGQWIRPGDALKSWRRGEVLLAPPTVFLLEALSDGAMKTPERFVSTPAARGEAHPTHSVLRPNITLFPLRTPTLPPATHTNTYVVGRDVLMVVEPASPYADERRRLDAYLDARIAAGARVEAIALTHHHHDHIGGVAYLAERLGVPVIAHAETAARIDIPVERLVDEGDVIELDASTTLDVMHTPGHAPGHVCFIERSSGDAIVGDMVAGIGSILVEPGDGDMALYLKSLERMRDRSFSSLLPSHGPAIGGARHKLDQYIAHRLDREAQVLDALGRGPGTLSTLVDRVYVDVPPMMKAGPDGGLAGLSLRSHLDKLLGEGRAAHDGSIWALR